MMLWKEKAETVADITAKIWDGLDCKIDVCCYPWDSEWISAQFVRKSESRPEHRMHNLIFVTFSTIYFIFNFSVYPNDEKNFCVITKHTLS